MLGRPDPYSSRRGGLTINNPVVIIQYTMSEFRHPDPYKNQKYVSPVVHSSEYQEG